jgi:hypothetical protein
MRYFVQGKYITKAWKPWTCQKPWCVHVLSTKAWPQRA